MKKSNRSNMLLLELLIVIVFFAFSATVLMGMFSLGYRTEQNAEQRDELLAAAQNVADRLYMENDADAVLAEEHFAQSDDGSWMTESDDGVLTVTCHQEETQSGALWCAEVVGTLDGETLFTLPVSRYLPSEVAQ